MSFPQFEAAPVGVLPEPFQVMPPLHPDDYAALEKSILEHGILEPIKVDEHGVVIDGHHRQKIAAEHNLFCPKRTVRDLDDAAKRAMALTLNLDRRHLTREQRRTLVAESIKAEPQLSDREHGRRTGVDHKTAATVRDDLESTGEIPQSDKRVSADGRQRPASQPTRPDSVEPPKPRKRPLPDRFASAAWELEKVVAKVERLSDDPRFEHNKAQLRRNLGLVVMAQASLQRVVDKFEA